MTRHSIDIAGTSGRNSSPEQSEPNSPSWLVRTVGSVARLGEGSQEGSPLAGHNDRMGLLGDSMAARQHRTAEHGKGLAMGDLEAEGPESGRRDAGDVRAAQQQSALAASALLRRALQQRSHLDNSGPSDSLVANTAAIAGESIAARSRFGHRPTLPRARGAWAKDASQLEAGPGGYADILDEAPISKSRRGSQPSESLDLPWTDAWIGGGSTREGRHRQAPSSAAPGRRAGSTSPIEASRGLDDAPSKGAAAPTPASPSQPLAGAGAGAGSKPNQWRRGGSPRSRAVQSMQAQQSTPSTGLAAENGIGESSHRRPGLGEDARSSKAGAGFSTPGTRAR